MVIYFVEKEYDLEIAVTLCEKISDGYYRGRFLLNLENEIYHILKENT